MSQFIDEVEIEVTSGDGGNGIVAWRREKYEPLGGPAGGNGGRGGNIYLQATGDMSTLLDFRYKSKYIAPAGQRGGPKNMHGKGAKDITVRVPVGTVIKDADSGLVIADLVVQNQRIMVAQGGKGGRGNAMLATPTRRAPHHCEPGQPGVRRNLKLELKVLADVGIIGLPNAGKSSFLAVVTAARPKIGDYPFTTLEPNLGVVKLDYGSDHGVDGFVLADIPGLVEGAAEGIGLGHKFLKHVERTRILVHMVDISSEDPVSDIIVINKELAEYGGVLSSLPQIIGLNKSDIVDGDQAKQRADAVREKFPDTEVMILSTATGEGTRELINTLGTRLKDLKEKALEEGEAPEELEADEAAIPTLDESWEIERKKNVFTVLGDKPERLVSVTNMRDPESISHLYRVLRAMGIIDALIAAGIQPGDELNISGVVFTYGEDW